jgi:hypothetical protein
MANEIHMNTPLSMRIAPIELFSKFESATDPKHFHPFGCPVYVLSDTMQRDGKGSKWQERARVGIHLGTSPVHARNVSLVLGLKKGLVSPQSHVKHNDLFKTTTHKTKLTHYNVRWQVHTGFSPGTEDESLVQPALPPTAAKPVNRGDTAPQPASTELPWATTTATHDMLSSEGVFPDSTPTTKHVNNFILDKGNPNHQTTLPDAEGSSTTPEQQREVHSNMPEHCSTTPEQSSRAKPTAAPASAPPVVQTRTRTIRPPEHYQQDVAFIAQAWDCIWDIKDYEIQRKCWILLLLQLQQIQTPCISTKHSALVIDKNSSRRCKKRLKIMKIDTIGSWYPNHPFLMVPPFYLLCGQ